MSDAPKAVFVSYAREDTAAAQRLAEALRSHGVEVWFDQNELRGGEAWDQKIRKQINDCTLFLPIISAQTQSRNKGYFRLEWRLAVEQMHLMAEGSAFLAPVVVDDTLEAGALVPPEFLRVQWTRLPGALPTPQFVEQIKRLLNGPDKNDAGRGLPPSPGHGAPGRIPSTDSWAGFATGTAASAGDPAAHRTKKGIPGWVWGAAVAAIVAIAAVVMVTRKPEPAVAPAKETAEAKPAPVKPASEAAAAAPSVVVAKIDGKSIAVLPFDNMSEEKDASAFFADGMHEDILTNLALIHELRVVSRTSVMQYRATTKTVRQIGDELGVAYVLEGSVRRSGNKVRVTGQLINARTDEHVWAKAYDRDITDIFAIQAELSQEIATQLAAALSPQEKLLLERRPTENLAAYDAYLKAHQLAEGGLNTGQEFTEIEALLKKAVELDPKFAAAWAELGRAYAFVYFNETDRSGDRLAQAKAAIETAVRLAPDSPEVIENYGDYFYYGFRDYERAVEQYQRLAVLRPNDAVVFGSIGLIHRRQGRWAESLAELRRAVQLEPRNLRYLRALQQLVQALNLYDEATLLQQRLVDLGPDNVVDKASLLAIPFFAHGSTAEVNDWLAHLKPEEANSPFVLFGRKQWAIQIGNWAEAIRLDGLQRYYEAFGTPHWGQDLGMAYVHAANGDMTVARDLAQAAIAGGKEELEKKPSAGAWSGLGSAYALLGNKDEALRCARKALELVPESTDAVAGPGQTLNYAGDLAWLGEKDEALAILARLLRTPYGENIYQAKYGLNWFPLRGDPRFEALVNDPKNNAPMN